MDLVNTVCIRIEVGNEFVIFCVHDVYNDFV